MLADFKEQCLPWEQFPEYVGAAAWSEAKHTFQLNDTHPAVAIPELIRLLVDREHLTLGDAIEITSRCMNYTNHTVLPEALETWDVELFGRLLPRHLQIIYALNDRLMKEVQKHYPYVLFMAVLMFLYIANGFHTQKLHRQHERLTARVKELRAQSLTISSQRMIATRQSEIIRELEERGIPLDELVSPPKIIDK